MPLSAHYSPYPRGTPLAPRVSQARCRPATKDEMKTWRQTGHKVGSWSLLSNIFSLSVYIQNQATPTLKITQIKMWRKNERIKDTEVYRGQNLNEKSDLVTFALLTSLWSAVEGSESHTFVRSQRKKKQQPTVNKALKTWVLIRFLLKAVISDKHPGDMDAHHTSPQTRKQITWLVSQANACSLDTFFINMKNSSVQSIRR